MTVSEIFGPTFQGEGASVGRCCGFLRLGNCNLSCRWCDTGYTWDWTRFDKKSELKRMTVPAVRDGVMALGVPMIIVSGGEPLLQQGALIQLLAELPPEFIVELETNGTIVPEPELVERVDRFNVSPKLKFAGGDSSARLRRPALEAFAALPKASFKFVAGSIADLDEVQMIVDAYGLRGIWVMPEATTREAVLSGMETLGPALAGRGWNLGSRLHVLLYGNRRGV